VKTIAIFVATTGGPAEIERLTPEFAPQSMVCLRRGSDILPISDDYDDFVKRGSGVIEREFGPFDTASFRMDVSESIGAGKSWQLGVFAAHAVAASSELSLAGDDATPDLVVWLTGEVDYDLGVGSVGHLPEKIAASHEFFTKWQQAGVPVLALVPEGQNFAEIIELALPEGVEVVAVSKAIEIYPNLGISENYEYGLTPPNITSDPKGLGPYWLGGLIILILFVLLAGVDGYRSGFIDEFFSTASIMVKEKNTKKTEAKLASPTKISSSTSMNKPIPVPQIESAFQVFERRSPDNATCAKVHFDRVEAEAVEIKTANGGALAGSHKKNICGLKFVLDLGEIAQFIAVELEIESGAFVSGNVKPSVFSGIKKAKGKQAWSLDLPRRLAEPLHYSLTAIIGKQPAAAEILWFKKQNDGKRAAQALLKKGFVVLTWSHKIAP
jgi:hypothetical protein